MILGYGVFCFFCGVIAGGVVCSDDASGTPEDIFGDYPNLNDLLRSGLSGDVRGCASHQPVLRESVNSVRSAGSAGFIAGKVGKATFHSTSVTRERLQDHG